MAVEATHRLALNLLKAIAKKETGNIFISPLSVATVLSMLYCGACKGTASEIIKVLGLSSISAKDLEASFDHLLSALDRADSAYSLECANAAILQSNFPVKDYYKDVLKKSFHAMVIHENFTKGEQVVVDHINKWVESKTHGMISRLLDSLDKLTVMVLLNAIYFKGTWETKFSEKATRLRKFYNKGAVANAKEVDMMDLKEKFYYAEFETYKALQLPYKGNNIAMLILLPNSLDGLEEIEKHLAHNFVRNIGKSMQNRKVRVSLPKFRMEFSKSLKETFQELGVQKTFKDDANLSGISDLQSLKVSDIVHKAVIEVNEEGTVAAAATGVRNTMALSRELEFTVNHPFLFTIYDIRNNTYLFIGRIVEL
ncbi:Serpin B10 [Araneus ventricosus]|uniref:Serpin B10 n=1 Tax=Araneus ventricosus TaxID=182803 RepID=A0A4Y2R6P9_ARAVE|nr:Serpin B10 [Araneus ventricosus]